MDSVALLGYIAGTLSTIAFLPQVVRSLQLRSTRGLSLSMLVIMGTAVALWSVYGLLIASLPIVIPNAVMVVLILVLIGLRIRFG
jgi:MtN3 and saliva related transmembrane protein